ncbi:MAG: MFS transporter [Vampirovibrionales bacterium]|nr:MFS transporter [Vampirovibrionales bacterium]
MSATTLKRTERAIRGESAPLFTQPFVMLCLASLLFFGATNLLSPVLPLYFQYLHFDGAIAGLLMAIFLLASMCVRPWIGKLTDRGNKKHLILLGLLIFIVSSTLFVFFSDQYILIALRVMQGIGFALVYTAATSAVIDIIPTERRVEGISHFSNSMKIAMAISPVLGLWLAQKQMHLAAFEISIFLSLLTIVCVAVLPAQFFKYKQAQKNLLKRLGADDKPVVGQSLSQPPGRLICPQAVLPGLVMLTNGLGFGALIPYIPLLASEKAIANAGLFYTVYAVCLILSRGMTGKIVDKLGRSTIVLPALALVILSLMLLAWTSNDVIFLLAAAVYGLANGTLQPTLLAVAVDRSPKNESGSAMATFTVLNDMGTAAGQFLMGYMGVTLGYANSLLGIAACSIVGCLIYMWQHQQEEKPKPCMGAA